VKILSVAYPFAPVSPSAAGGAEQVLWSLERAITAAGHDSTVIACEGSRVSGRLVAVPRVEGTIDDAARARIYAACRDRVRHLAYEHDLVHMHGIDFYEYLPQSDVPAVVSLHLPVSWYPKQAFTAPVQFACVSKTQAEEAPVSVRVIPNGIDVDHFRSCVFTRGFVLAYGRICPEKGFHLAMDAAREAGVHMLLAGEVHPYPEHQAYFETEIRPRLGGGRARFIGPLEVRRKRHILAGAKCVLIPSLVAETSSLVAMEAAASGTPVIAFRSGALPEIVRHGVTGFIVDGVSEMAAAIPKVNAISPDRCRRWAREHFDAARMHGEYLSLYEQIAQVETPAR
jgi:glycosyltransferase involved in cell wall biosynthesis